MVLLHVQRCGDRGKRNGSVWTPNGSRTATQSTSNAVRRREAVRDRAELVKDMSLSCPTRTGTHSHAHPQANRPLRQILPASTTHIHIVTGCFLTFFCWENHCHIFYFRVFTLYLILLLSGPSWGSVEELHQAASLAAWLHGRGCQPHSIPTTSRRRKPRPVVRSSAILLLSARKRELELRRPRHISSLLLHCVTFSISIAAEMSSSI